MTFRFHPLQCAVLLALAAPAAHATDLLQSYDAARQSDPRLGISEANRGAQGEGVVQSRASLLPQIDASATLSKSNTNSSSISSRPDASGNVTFGPTAGNSDISSRNYTVNLQQSIYDRANYTRLDAARSRAEQYDALYDSAANGLIVRVAEAYFNVLSAIQDVASLRAQERSLKRQLDQANVRLEVGLAPITDAQEAKAQYDVARATSITAATTLADAREALTEITGQAADHLKGLPADYTPQPLTPANVDAWVQQAVDNNPDVRAQQLALDAANHDVETARAGHLPTLAGSASYGKRAQWGSSSFDNGSGASSTFPATSANNGPSYSVQLIVPIFSGFATSSRVRQALFNRDAAADQLELTKRSIVRQARNYFNSVNAGLAEIEARRQALLSAQTAYEATETGLEVGTRTIVDVLITQQQLFSAQRDYARARNAFIVNGLRLRQAAGSITIDDLANVNRLLTADAENALQQPANGDLQTMPGLPSRPSSKLPLGAPPTKSGKGGKF
ncbi:MAG: TolC family outer membrane protein [Lysobacteraceae bacterium]